MRNRIRCVWCWSQREAVQTSLFSKGLEFETFKIRVVDLLPDTDEFERVAVPHPTVNQDIVAKLFRHVRQGNVVLLVLLQDGDGRALNLDGGGFFALAHGSVGRVFNSLEFDGIKTGVVSSAGLPIVANSPQLENLWNSRGLNSGVNWPRQPKMLLRVLLISSFWRERVFIRCFLGGLSPARFSLFASCVRNARGHARAPTDYCRGRSSRQLELGVKAESGAVGFGFIALPLPHVRSSSSPLANRFVRTIAKPAFSGKKELLNPPRFAFGFQFQRFSFSGSRVERERKRQC
jgi:hypothetical protein